MGVIKTKKDEKEPGRKEKGKEKKFSLVLSISLKSDSITWDPDNWNPVVEICFLANTDLIYINFSSHFKWPIWLSQLGFNSEKLLLDSENN